MRVPAPPPEPTCCRLSAWGRGYRGLKWVWALTWLLCTEPWLGHPCAMPHRHQHRRRPQAVSRPEGFREVVTNKAAFLKPTTESETTLLNNRDLHLWENKCHLAPGAGVVLVQNAENGRDTAGMRYGGKIDPGIQAHLSVLDSFSSPGGTPPGLWLNTRGGWGRDHG